MCKDKVEIIKNRYGGCRRLAEMLEVKEWKDRKTKSNKKEVYRRKRIKITE